MTRTYKIGMLLSVMASAAVATTYVRAGAQVVTPRPDELRFQAVLNEPIAAGGQRGVVAGMSALVVKDRLTGQCFLAVTLGDAMGLSPTACPP